MANKQGDPNAFPPSKPYSECSDAELKARAMKTIRQVLDRERAVLLGTMQHQRYILDAREAKQEVPKEKDTKLTNTAIEGYLRYGAIKDAALVKMIALVEQSIRANEEIMEDAARAAALKELN